MKELEVIKFIKSNKERQQTKTELIAENKNLRELGSNYALQLEQIIKQLQLEKEYSKKFEEKSNHYFELVTNEAEENTHTNPYYWNIIWYIALPNIQGG